MQFTTKCVVFVCIGIRESAEHNSESKIYYSGKTEKGLLKPTPVGSRGLIDYACMNLKLDLLTWLVEMLTVW